jgi:hypothetical protein
MYTHVVFIISKVESSWESTPSSSIAPRWQLQTDQEKLEQLKVIQKLGKYTIQHDAYMFSITCKNRIEIETT